MTIITADQSRVARRELGLSQADVATAVGINRQYVSEFETGYSNRITAAQQRKLRQFYESKVQEAAANDDEIHLTFGEQQPEPSAASETPAQEIAPEPAQAPAKFWPVFLEVPTPTAVKVMGMVQDNDARLAVLLQQVAERDTSLFSDGEFTDETLEALQEAFSLMAVNYTLFRSLSGWPALGLTPSTEEPQTLRDVVLHTFQQQLEEAGLIAEPELDDVGAEE